MKTLKFLMPALACLLLIITSCEKDQVIKEGENPAFQANQLDNSQGKRSCGMQEHMNKLLKNPDYRRQHEAKFALMQEHIGLRSNVPVSLPVAVHFQGISNPDIQCLRTLAINQIASLNADYSATNGDIGNWTGNAASSFPGVNNGATNAQFCLATKNHPNGYGLNNGDVAVTVNQTTGDFNADWSGYINIFVQSGTGVLGYSPLGGQGNGDGVVIEAGAFGAGGSCPGITPFPDYNLGRTLTHEVGHYLLLDHIWGGSGGCNDDDGVADTPVSSDPYYGCPQIGASTCSSTDMHMNYMDYTNDACMYMFSAGQASRMDGYVSSSLQNLINNASNVCGSVTNPPSPCNTPGGLAISNVAQTSADANWNAANGATSYQIEIRETGANNWTTDNTASTGYSFTGLNACTDYEVRVKALCSGGNESSYGAVVTFKTTGCTGGPGGPGTCDAAAVNPYTGEALSNQPCIAQVQQDDPYCCDVFWDGLCQDAYDQCVATTGGGGGNPPTGNCPVVPIDPYTGEVLDDAACIEEVQEIDPYCCDVEWDGICQAQYDACVYGFSFSKSETEPYYEVFKTSAGKVKVSYFFPAAKSEMRIRIVDNGGRKIVERAVTSRRATFEIKDRGFDLENGVYMMTLLDEQASHTKQFVLTDQ